MDHKTYYLFGELAVREFENTGSVQTIKENEIAHETYCFDPEQDPTGGDLLSVANGWNDYAQISKEQYDELS